MCLFIVPGRETARGVGMETGKSVTGKREKRSSCSTNGKLIKNKRNDLIVKNQNLRFKII